MSKKNPKTKKQKEAMIAQLKRIPIIEIAVEKININRSTYYLWRKKDEEFAKLADEAIAEGVAYINDLSESQLIGGHMEFNQSG